MAIIHMDGFDGYSSASDLALFYATSSASFSTTGGRFGGGAFQFTDVGYLMLPEVMPSDFWVGFAFSTSNTRNQDCVFAHIINVTTTEAIFAYNPASGVFAFYWGNAASKVAYASRPITDGKYHWIDLHWKYDASGSGGGVTELWVDGLQVINWSGRTAGTGGETSWTLQLGSITFNTPAGYIDDLVVVDTTGSRNNGRIGDSRIETLQPTSDASPNDGTTSSGSNHYATVNDTTWNASNYVTITNTSGQEELFGMASLSSTPTSIAAVQVVHYSQKTDTGAARLKAVIVSGGAESAGASTPLGTAWKRFHAPYETDPNTSAAWTTSGVNALKAGVKVQ